jgi:hypothetical protein
MSNPRKAFEQAKQASERKEVKVDWNDLKSITKAERQKSKLENAGYTLVQTKGGLTTSTLVYEKK